MTGKESPHKPDLDDELDRLQEWLPNGVSIFVRKMRSPAVAPYRIPAGIVLTLGGVVGFLPILGFQDGAARPGRARAGRAGDAPADGPAAGEDQWQADAVEFQS